MEPKNPNPIASDSKSHKIPAVAGVAHRMTRARRTIVESEAAFLDGHRVFADLGGVLVLLRGSGLEALGAGLRSGNLRFRQLSGLGSLELAVSF